MSAKFGLILIWSWIKIDLLPSQVTNLALGPNWTWKSQVLDLIQDLDLTDQSSVKNLIKNRSIFGKNDHFRQKSMKNLIVFDRFFKNRLRSTSILAERFSSPPSGNQFYHIPRNGPCQAHFWGFWVLLTPKNWTIFHFEKVVGKPDNFPLKKMRG